MRGPALILTFVALSVLSAESVASISYNSPVTNNAIWGSGNTNQGFTVVQDNGIEIGIRAKTRYPAPNDSVAGIMNQLNGDYGSFPTGNFGPGGVRGSWNFDWSVNSDWVNGSTALSAFTYIIDIDFDPSQAVGSLYSFNLLNSPTDYDHAFGTNATANSAGTQATSLANAQSLATTNNLMQNSWNLAFFPPAFNPAVDGTYTIAISAYERSDTGALGALLAASSIDVIVGNGGAPVPEPLSFLTWGGLIGCAIVAARRQQR